MSRDRPAICELRPAVAADRDAIAAIWHGGASLPRVGPSNLPTLAELRERADEGLAGGWVATVAVRGGEVVGFAAMKPREAVLAELFVRPGSTGGGIGKLLLEHVKSAMPAGFTLYTRVANAGARRFYEREGLAFLRDGAHQRTGEPVVFYSWDPPRPAAA